MPVILLPEDEEAWLNPDMTEVGEITRYRRPYLKAHPGYWNAQARNQGNPTSRV